MRMRIGKATVNLSATWTGTLTVLILSSGCHLRPDLGPPGTIGNQRAKAVLHDPFPNNDLGPPVLGSRPLGFDRPLSEAMDLQGSPFARRNGDAVPNNYGF